MDFNQIRKALDVATLTSDYLNAELFDGAIRDYVSLEPVIYNTGVTRQPWAGQTYNIRLRTTNPTATWKADGAGLPSVTTARHTKATLPMAYLYTAGSVTGPAIKAAQSLINAVADDIEQHSRAIVEELSDNIVLGEGDADDLTGMIFQITDSDDFNAGSDDGGRTVDGGSDDLTLEMLDELIDRTQGQADTIVCSRKVNRVINRLLQQFQRFPETVEVAAGFRVRSYDGRPILSTLQWEEDDEILAYRRSDAKLLVHEDFNYNELGRVGDSISYFIKGYFGFVLEGRPALLNAFTLPEPPE